MTTSDLVYSTDTPPVVGPYAPEPDFEDEGCLGSNGTISTSSCNRIAARLTGAWCPSCHPGDDVPISLAWED